jgi:hypothetical protein
MLTDLLSQYSQTILSIQGVMMLLTVVLHIIFAGGIARDIGERHRNYLPIQFIPGFAWVLATLIGGILVLVAYWLIHHSTLAKR